MPWSTAGNIVGLSILTLVLSQKLAKLKTVYATGTVQARLHIDHEELCGTSYGSFCLNGGICYMIPTVSSPFCRCIENYTGARCEEVLLPSIKSQTKGDLFAVFLASVVLLGVLAIGAFYFLCRKASIPRRSSLECSGNLVETTSSNGCNILFR
ncbi:pro-neuregulin-4, membrane-bound isoform isoform X2 [Dromaius novaehollandiae]|uniref:pro-neuregulin-4, membrane-bound isoform isoform X2 n=1 Tax=Dromaius novaehollandiae TaxID=8790 RepID=UPI00311FC6D5